MKRICRALLFIFLMAITALPVSAAGQEAERGQGVYINPLYSDIVKELPASEADDGAAAASTPTYYSTTAKAANYLRDAMVSRKTNLNFQFFSKKSNMEKALDQLLEKACEADDTTAPDEGDYLRWHMLGCSYSYSAKSHSGGGYDYTIKGNFYYHSTAKQEQMVTQKINQVMALPEIRDARTEYEAVKAIYNYVTSHVTYDYSIYYYPGNYIPNPSPFSAYKALCQGTAVCQGYASLIYRMMRMEGLSVRFIGGESQGEGHAWNIVRIGGLYYNLDSTWDAGLPESRYEYFLRGESAAQFPDHTRDPEYRTDAFYDQYPMSFTAYNTSSAAVPISGNSISYVLNGGTNDPENPATYFRQEVVLKSPGRAGYAFAGWYTDSKFKNRIKSIPATATQNYTLYAKWTKVTVGKAKVTAYRADGTGFTVKYQAVSGADGYRILYTHSSDFADETVRHLDVSASSLSGTVSVSDADERYYVKVRAYKLDSTGAKVWGKKSSAVKGYQIKYELDGGVNNVNNPYFISSWKYTLKDPVREGYKFRGWYTDKKFKNKITVIKKTNKKSRTLYARWEKE